MEITCDFTKMASDKSKKEKQLDAGYPESH